MTESPSVVFVLTYKQEQRLGAWNHQTVGVYSTLASAMIAADQDERHHGDCRTRIVGCFCKLDGDDTTSPLEWHADQNVHLPRDIEWSVIALDEGEDSATTRPRPFSRSYTITPWYVDGSYVPASALAEATA